MNYNGIDIVVSEETYNEYKETLEEQIKDLQTRIIKAVEYINKFESIRAYYEYEDCGYTEYNYDEDFKEDLLDILRGEE